MRRVAHGNELGRKAARGWLAASEAEFRALSPTGIPVECGTAKAAPKGEGAPSTRRSNPRGKGVGMCPENFECPSFSRKCG